MLARDVFGQSGRCDVRQPVEDRLAPDTGDLTVSTEVRLRDFAPFMTYWIERFGPDRCMFESNFPPDKVSFSHHVLFNAFKRFSKGYSASERATLFHDTAVRAYRISDVKL